VFIRAINNNTGKPMVVPLTTPNAVAVGWHSGVRLRDITDGQSSTLLFGEKHLILTDADRSVFNGADRKSYVRSCGIARPIVVNPQLNPLDGGRRFGSAHPALCHFARVDGSVVGISPSISPTILEALATRSKGEVVAEF
jgi:hypothetical protein